MGNSDEQILGESASSHHREGGPDAHDQGPPPGSADARGTWSYRMVSLAGRGALSSELRAAWQTALERQETAGGSASPFLGPSFAAAVASVRPDVQLAVGYLDGEPRSFLPLHVGSRGRARPLGGRFCDLHGPVGVDDSGAFQEMLAGAGLRSWSFRRCPQRSALDPRFVFAETLSHVVRTDLGIDGLRGGGLLKSTGQLKQALRKERKLTKEVGPLRFEFDHRDPAILDSLIRWKGDQRRRSGSTDILEQSWARDTLQALQDERHSGDPATLDGRGKMSVLWAGDHVVAAHFGLASPSLMHWWIPTYSLEFASYSPGLSLLLHIIRDCHASGIEALDLGHGDARYKSGFATRQMPLFSGAVDRSRVRLAVGAASFRLRGAVRESRLEPGWVATKRFLRRAKSAGTRS